MRRSLISAAVLAMCTALPAMAQSQAAELSPPTVSETEKAEPDWYRQFTLSSPSDERPIWQSTPSKEVRLAFVKGDKWQLSVDMTSRPEDSPLPREEMRAGAEFRITPRISVGGSLSVGANNVDQALEEFRKDQIEAGIRLRSAFKF